VSSESERRWVGSSGRRRRRGRKDCWGSRPWGWCWKLVGGAGGGGGGGVAGGGFGEGVGEVDAVVKAGGDVVEVAGGIDAGIG